MCFRHTKAIAIELSNVCSLAGAHKKCPLHLEKEIKVLSAAVVRQVLEVAGRHEYSGQLSFSQYNEPLEDPRLFTFLNYVGEVCPGVEVYVITNGRFLSQVMVEELSGAGVEHIIVSLYGSQAEQEAKRRQAEELCVGIWAGGHDDRLSIYDRQEVNWDRPCSSPLGQVVVTRDADVGLCCMDWRRQYTFGSLYERSLEEILVSEEVLETHRRLSLGDRFLDICKRCTTGRQ